MAQWLSEAGVPSRRVIGSGAYGGLDSRLVGDLQIGVFEDEKWMLTGEVKARKDGRGFAQLDGWLGDNDVLLLKRNFAAPAVYMSGEMFLRLLRAAYAEEINNAGIGSSDVPSSERVLRGEG